MFSRYQYVKEPQKISSLEANFKRNNFAVNNTNYNSLIIFSHSALILIFKSYDCQPPGNYAHR